MSFKVDLRSDTVTLPTPAMRKAMAEAPLGDDVIDKDPTVERLQERVAELLGKESALFMPSGTMTNQVAVRLHCRPGDEFLCEANCHIYCYEQGAFAQLSGLVARTFEGQHGVLDISQLAGQVHPENDHLVSTRLITLENTHNRGGGTVQPIEQVDAICSWANENSLATHLDVARLFNAVATSGVEASRWVRDFDSVSVCFSKGLGAPVGSALAGTKEFIRQAKRTRKLFGGGMRQAGVIAAGALHALENHRERMREDHEHARLLAEAISTNESFTLDPAPETNIVIARLDEEWGDSQKLVSLLADVEIGALPFGPQHVRFVTHLDISHAQIEFARQEILKL